MSHLTQFQTFFLLSVLKIVVVLVITLTAVAYTVLLERKVIGRMQNRWGPSRTGPFGLLQPLADGIKLFLKEDLTPILVEKPLFLVAPIIALACALVSIAVVPFGALTTYQGVDLFEIANCKYRAAGDPGDYVDRRVRHCAFGLVEQQQVCAAGQSAGYVADDQL